MGTLASNTKNESAANNCMFRLQRLARPIGSYCKDSTNAFVAPSGDWARSRATGRASSLSPAPLSTIPSHTVRLMSSKIPEKAKDFFSDPRFYDGSEEVAALCANKRHEKFGDASIGSVLKKLKTEVQAIDYFKGTGIHVIAVFPFVRWKNIEDALDCEGIFTLNAKHEIDLVHDRYEDVGLLTPIIEEASKKSPFFWVFGASGIGKTFYAVKQLATCGMSNLQAAKHVTLYLKPFEVQSFKSNKNGRELADWIKGELVKEYGRFVTLNMHISLVLDDAHSPDKCFESAWILHDLYSGMREYASTVRLIVVGARICAGRWDNGDKIYLDNWSRREVEVLASRSSFQLKQDVVSSIFEKPILSLLATDALSTWLLLTALKDESASDKLAQPGCPDDMKLILAAIVIDLYKVASSLGQLSDESRRRVAAWVLHAAENAKKEGRYGRTMPKLEGLNESEKDAAYSLMSLNLERSYGSLDSVRDARDSYRGDKDRLAAEVSPAMDTVLLSVLYGTEKIVASYEDGSTVIKLREPVVTAVDQYLKRFGADPDRAGKELDRRLKSFSL
jgi:hypothetical protein